MQVRRRSSSEKDRQRRHIILTPRPMWEVRVFQANVQQLLSKIISQDYSVPFDVDVRYTRVLPQLLFIFKICGIIFFIINVHEYVPSINPFYLDGAYASETFRCILDLSPWINYALDDGNKQVEIQFIHYFISSLSCYHTFIYIKLASSIRIVY